MWPFKKKKHDIQSEIDQRVGVAVSRIKAQVGYNTSYQYYSGGAGGEKFPGGLSSSGMPRVFNNRLLRRNARNAYHDTPQAKAIVDRFADTIADVGLVLECSPRANILGITPQRAQEWASDVSERFDLWAKDKNAHRSGLMTFYQSHRKYQIFQHRDNDQFVRLYYSHDRDLQNPLQFEFIDPDQIRGDSYVTTYGDQSYSDGITRDARGREKSYKIWVQDKTGKNGYKDIDVTRVGSKSGRIFMLHGFDGQYAGQGRGFSRLSFALQEFQNITDFSLAHIKKAINESNVSLWVKPSSDNPASNPFEDISQQIAAGPVAGITSEPTTEEVVSTGIGVKYCPLPEATLSQPGSTGVFNLEEGEELRAFENKAPSDAFEPFVNAFLSHLSAGTGMPIEVLLMKFGNNYSASRATLILFWRICMMWRQEMATEYLNPIYHMWLAGEIAAGRVAAPGFSDPVLRAAWLHCGWIGSPMPNIDPAKTAKADKTYIELGAQTINRTAREHNGSDARSNMAALSEEYKNWPVPPWTVKNG